MRRSRLCAKVGIGEPCGPTFVFPSCVFFASYIPTVDAVRFRSSALSVDDAEAVCFWLSPKTRPGVNVVSYFNAPLLSRANFCWSATRKSDHYLLILSLALSKLWCRH